MDSFGGGDPDRTGDPRLMSPLLCQLSYTATAKKGAAKVPILPEEGSQCLRRGASLRFNARGFDPETTRAARALVAVLESVFGEGAS
jgi:hypothetical protein